MNNTISEGDDSPEWTGHPATSPLLRRPLLKAYTMDVIPTSRATPNDLLGGICI